MQQQRMLKSLQSVRDGTHKKSKVSASTVTRRGGFQLTIFQTGHAYFRGEWMHQRATRKELRIETSGPKVK